MFVQIIKKTIYNPARFQTSLKNPNMSDEVRIDVSNALELIVEDLTNVYGMVEVGQIDPVYHELQGRTDFAKLYVSTEGERNVLWCFHEMWFFATEAQDSDAARLEIELGTSGGVGYPFEIIITLYEDPRGENIVCRTDMLTIENEQHWAYIMVDYVQSYIQEGNDLMLELLAVMEDHLSDEESVWGEANTEAREDDPLNLDSNPPNTEDQWDATFVEITERSWMESESLGDQAV